MDDCPPSIVAAGCVVVAARAQVRGQGGHFIRPRIKAGNMAVGDFSNTAGQAIVENKSPADRCRRCTGAQVFTTAGCWWTARCVRAATRDEGGELCTPEVVAARPQQRVTRADAAIAGTTRITGQ